VKSVKDYIIYPFYPIIEGCFPSIEDDVRNIIKENIYEIVYDTTIVKTFYLYATAELLVIDGYIKYNNF
jgi:hypothetical protein